MRRSSVNTIVTVRTEERAIDADLDRDTALAGLYASHYAGLVRLATLLLRDQGPAEDVVQDSFVAVHGKWRRIEPATAPAYLRTTVVNRCRSALRHRTVALRHRPEPLPDDPSSGVDRHISARGLNDRVLGTVTPDRRSTGYGLSRHRDNPRLDFTRVSAEPDVHFAHARGFVAKTTATTPGRLRDLVRLAHLAG